MPKTKRKTTCGPVIAVLTQLRAVLDDEPSIYVYVGGKVRVLPTAVVKNWPFQLVLRSLESGYFYQSVRANA